MTAETDGRKYGTQCTVISKNGSVCVASSSSSSFVVVIVVIVVVVVVVVVVVGSSPFRRRVRFSSSPLK